jgi:hypothetical protein
MMRKVRNLTYGDQLSRDALELEAIGMSRRQTRRMIRHESILTALIGAALGPPLGILLAALTTRARGSLGIGFHLPGKELTASSCSRWWQGPGPPSSPPAERPDSACHTHSSRSEQRFDGSLPAPHTGPGTTGPNSTAPST